MMKIYLLCLGAIWAYETLWFLLAWVRGRNDVADIAWGFGFIVVSGVSLTLGDANPIRGLLLSGLVFLWGARLALHIHARNARRGEDLRYRQWREAWGRWFLLRSYLQIYLLQGALLVVVAIPVIFANASPNTPLGMLDLLGLVIWLTGFLFETLGDWQLLAFMHNPANKGKLMTTGLWRYTRHPNYFGEVLLWWGAWLIVCAIPNGWMTLIGPLTITFLILKVSGIPMLERHYAGRADFEAYKRRTSVFLPLPPRERSES
jgi:steroid 5-alpha reductase family enzyme